MHGKIRYCVEAYRYVYNFQPYIGKSNEKSVLHQKINVIFTKLLKRIRMLTSQSPFTPYSRHGWKCGCDAHVELNSCSIAHIWHIDIIDSKMYSILSPTRASKLMQLEGNTHTDGSTASRIWDVFVPLEHKWASTNILFQAILKSGIITNFSWKRNQIGNYPELCGWQKKVALRHSKWLAWASIKMRFAFIAFVIDKVISDQYPLETVFKLVVTRQSILHCSQLCVVYWQPIWNYRNKLALAQNTVPFQLGAVSRIKWMTWER